MPKQPKVYQRDREEIIPCRGCGVSIWFGRTESGKPIPITESTGETHFSTCKNGDEFRAKHGTKDCCAKKAQHIIKRALLVVADQTHTRDSIIDFLNEELTKVGG